MIRTERYALKRKYKRQQWIAYIMILLFVLNLTLLLTLDWRPEGDISIGLVLIIALLLFVPVMFGLHFNVQASWTHRALFDERKRMYNIKNKFYVGLFWEAILSADYEEAKRLYNLDNFITGSFRVLCNGIMMGCTHLSGADAEWNETAAQRMEDILLEED